MAKIEKLRSTGDSRDVVGSTVADTPIDLQPSLGDPENAPGTRAETVDREARIREIAYFLWLEDGMPHGMDQEHWYAAARRIEADSPLVEPAEAPSDVETAALDLDRPPRT